MQDVTRISPRDFDGDHSHLLPLARIKRVMRADWDVRMIASEAPALFSKACEFLIEELTTRAWVQTEENRRRTMQRTDVGVAASNDPLMDFLVDVLPVNE